MPVEERVICKRIPSLYQRNKQEDHHQRLRVKALSEIKGTNTTLSAFLFFFFLPGHLIGLPNTKNSLMQQTIHLKPPQRLTPFSYRDSQS